MSATGKLPQDLLAIFHASFHPTQGNLIDWVLKVNDDINLDQLEFNVLPSGLHLVERDVIYFTKDANPGVCVFRRRKTAETGQRGFRLSSFGILLAKGRRARPWAHLQGLKVVVDEIYNRLEASGVLEPTEADWDPARRFFEERRVPETLQLEVGLGEGEWNGWSLELDGANSSTNTPTLHLPHLLRILGPSALTLYKYVLGRQRVLIYTLPPVEAACVLCQVAADVCFQIQAGEGDAAGEGEGVGVGAGGKKRLRGRCKDPISVLGMVTLSDVDRLRRESATGRGWIACTTDAIFLERPAYYDLLIDLTACAPSKAARPAFYASKPVPASTSRGPTHRLSTVRFAWSDVSLWTELSRILALSSSASPTPPACCSPPDSSSTSSSGKPAGFITAWTDAWRVYEDVCLVCAGIWAGSWRGSGSVEEGSWDRGDGEGQGEVRLEGPDELALGSVQGGEGAYVRNVGMGIEGTGTSTKSFRRASALSARGGPSSASSSSHGKSPGETEPGEEEDDAQLRTTLALLQTFHAHTLFQLSILEGFLPPSSSSSSSSSSSLAPPSTAVNPSPSITLNLPSTLNPPNPRSRSHSPPSALQTAPPATITLTPRDILSFSLGPLSALDARYLEWLAAEYAAGARVVVRRGWRDFLGVVFGYG